MATIQLQLARRLGAARVLLQGVAGTQRHAAVSNIQKVAALELLTDAMASQRLSGEDLARINDQIMEVQWAPGHEEELLLVVSQKQMPKRRKQQNFCASTAYISNNGWVRFLDPHSDLNAKADFLTTFNAVQLDCINPTEPSYKRWVSDILVAHFDKDTLRGLSASSKYALLDYVKKSHKRLVKNRAAQPEVYLLELPSNPIDLREHHPTMFNSLFPDGQPVRNRLDESLVMQIDASFQCRGGTKSTTPMPSAIAPSPPIGDMVAQFLPMMMQGLANMMHGGSTQVRFDTRGSHGGRRSLKALEGEPGEETPRARRLAIEPPAMPPRVDAPSSLSAASSAPDVTHAHGSESGDDALANPEKDVAKASGKSPGDVMLDAILARDAAARLAASEKAAANRLAKKLAAAEVGAETPKVAPHSLDADAIAPAPSKKRKDIVLKATPAEAPAKKAKMDNASPATKASLPTHAVAKPSMSHERSRHQFLCRTGVKGQPSEKFRYLMNNGDKGEYPNEAAAKKAAEAWVKARMPK